MHELLQDVRFGLRTLLRARTFTVVTVLTLALAIGLNSTIFSMVGFLLIGDLPIAEVERVTFVRGEHAERGLVRQELTEADYVALRDAVDAGEIRSVETLAAFAMDFKVVGDDAQSERLPVALMTPSLDHAWGLTPAHGRSFLPEEGEPGAARVAMLSHPAWQHRYGGDPEVLGTTLQVDGYETTIVGVLDEGMAFGDLARFDFWLPLVPDAAAPDTQARGYFTSAKLTSASSFEQARQEVAALGQRQEEAHPATHEGWSMAVKHAREDLADDGFWTILTLLGITVFGVLLVACSNVATLTLARSAERSRELSVRAALGAGRLRILRQLLTESTILSLSAGALGLAVTAGAQRGLVWVAGDGASITYLLRMMTIDHTVLAYTLGLAVLAPLFFGLLPAVHAARRDLRSGLHEGSGRSGGSRGALRSRRWLVGVQVAVALTLMLVVGTLVKSLQEERKIDLGYDTAAILSTRIDLPEARYGTDDERRQAYRSLLDEVRAAADVAGAAWSSTLPIEGGLGGTPFEIEGRATPDGTEMPLAQFSSVDPEFFPLLDVGVQRGRGLAATDDAQGRRVAVINRDTADRFFPDGDAVGAHIRLAAGDDRESLEIVGIVGSLRRPSLIRPTRPEIYVPWTQAPTDGLALLVRARTADPALAGGSIRRAVQAVDARLPVPDVQTLQQRFEENWGTVLAIESLLGSFALFALLIAAAGIYGVASFVVARRRRELGIRMALGAQRFEIGTLVLRQATGILLAGGALGVLGGWALLQMLASGLEGIDAIDVGAWATMTAVLLVVAFTATGLPARRAARLDPAKALREE